VTLERPSYPLHSPYFGSPTPPPRLDSSVIPGLTSCLGLALSSDSPSSSHPSTDYTCPRHHHRHARTPYSTTCVCPSLASPPSSIAPSHPLFGPYLPYHPPSTAVSSATSLDSSLAALQRDIPTHHVPLDTHPYTPFTGLAQYSDKRQTRTCRMRHRLDLSGALHLLDRWMRGMTSLWRIRRERAGERRLIGECLFFYRSSHDVSSGKSRRKGESVSARARNF
jgi:hypothetical protein